MFDGALGPHTLEVGHVEPGRHGERGEFAPERTVEGCMVYPRGSTEDTGRQATVITGLTALLPPGSVVGPRDQVRFKGEVYDVDGDVGEWDFLDGSAAAVQVNLERAKD